MHQLPGAVSHTAQSAGEPVAVIGGAAITMAAFEHWLTVANDSDQASTGAAAPPLPVPPEYTACASALGRQPGSSGSSATALRSQCAERYKTLLTAVMRFLIQAVWIQGEANARGITVTPAQVEANFAQQRQSGKPALSTDAELDAFLAKSGQTIVDLEWRTRLNLLATATQKQVNSRASDISAAQIAAYYTAHRSALASQGLAAATSQIRQILIARRRAAANQALQTDFTVTWRRHTICRAGFAISSCGSTAPAIAADPSASYPGLIELPPSQAQPLHYTPGASAPAPSNPASTVTTPTSGPLATEPQIHTPTGPPPHGLLATDLIRGTGATAHAGETITVNYVGALYDGKVFDSSWQRQQTFTTKLDTASVIKGWVEGLAGMRVGGRRELVIPASLAYGDQRDGAIAPNSTLIFIVDLLAVTR
jgi:peptidylprolyl isomerase